MAMVVQILQCKPSRCKPGPGSFPTISWYYGSSEQTVNIIRKFSREYRPGRRKTSVTCPPGCTAAGVEIRPKQGNDKGQESGKFTLILPQIW